jgi:hypothetical protein
MKEYEKLKLNLNTTILVTSTHAPNEEKDEVAKEEFYSSLEKVCGAVPNYDMKTELADFNAEVGKSPIYIQPSQQYK